jgi:Domain of unknown function (DUF309)
MATLPLRLRNRVAEAILAAFHDAAARRALEELAAASRVPPSWLAPGEQHYAATLQERARRGVQALAARPSRAGTTELDAALDVAAALFDAGLYFETHEVLEAHWRTATGDIRDILQGLIQIAVGYQHWLDDNLAGARSLLAEGTTRLRASGAADATLGSFARAVDATYDRIGSAPPAVPSFPRSVARGIVEPATSAVDAPPERPR